MNVEEICRQNNVDNLKWRRSQIYNNVEVINNFISRYPNIDIRVEEFVYVETIGLFLKHSNIVLDIHNDLSLDKDGLLSWKMLRKLYVLNKMSEGYLCADDYMLMAAPEFRRGYKSMASWAPLFIYKFWTADFSNCDAYISMDLDRLRINVDGSIYAERDVWYGAPYRDDVSSIPIGSVKLTPPLSLKRSHINFLFASSYALYVDWYLDGEMKVFQCWEFKNENVVMEENGSRYYPVRYMHSIYDLNKKHFVHMDGALHSYDEENYLLCRDDLLDCKGKNLKKYKPKSKKLFKINGVINVAMWVEFVSHFLSKNPLAYEYFMGNYPDYLQERLLRIQSSNH